MTDLHIIIGKTVDEKFYFRIRIEGGRIMLTSREYNLIEKCLNEIYTIQQYQHFELREERHTDSGYHYALITSRGSIVAESPFYSFIYVMRNDMSFIKKYIRKAEVIDKSSLVRFFRPVRIK